MPRRCSSAKRSGSVPVSIRTSDDLPWSTCPAVATSNISRGVPGAQRSRSCTVEWLVRRSGRQPLRLRTTHSAGSVRPAHRARAAARAGSSDGETERRSRNVAPSRPRAITGGSLARSVARWSPGRQMPIEGIVAPGAEPAPGTASVSTISHRPAAIVPRPGPQPGLRLGGHLPERDGGDRRAGEIGKRHRLERTDDVPARPHGAGQRVAQAGGDEVGPPGDDPGLRAAEQLVAAERHQPCAGGQRLAGARFAGQPRRRRAGEPRAGLVEQAAAEVGDDRNAELGQRVDGCRLDESLDPVVARVDLEDQCGRATATALA